MTDLIRVGTMTNSVIYDYIVRNPQPFGLFIFIESRKYL